MKTHAQVKGMGSDLRGRVMIALALAAAALTLGLAAPRPAAAAQDGTVTASLTVRLHTDPHCCGIGGPAVGDVVPVFCYRDGKTATYQGGRSQRWFLIQYAQTPENHPIGFISVMAFNNQPHVGKCVYNSAWPEDWAPTSSDGPPSEDIVTPKCGQMLGPQPGQDNYEELCGDGSGSGSGSGTGSGSGSGSGSGTASSSDSGSTPVFGVMNTSESPPDGVWFRNSPHTGDTDRVTGHGVYSGESVQLQCYGYGDSVGRYNDSLWYFVTNVSRPTNAGVANSGWLNAHYINDNVQANQIDDGVPSC